MARGIPAPKPSSDQALRDISPDHQLLQDNIRDISPDRLVESNDSESEEGDYHDIDETDNENVEAELLYRRFLARRMEEEEARSPLMHQNFHHNRSSDLDIDLARRMQTSHHDHNRSSNLDIDLATLADRFNRSPGREQVRQKAEEVELETLSQENFTLLLTELFRDGGVSQERVLVLFFFCSDLALRAIRSGLATVLGATTRWTLAFLRGTVTAWVRCQGGWRALFGTTSDNLIATANQIAFLGMCAAVICVCVVYVRKNT